MPNPIFLSKDKINQLIATAKSEVKAEIISQLTNTEPPLNFDPDTLTVYFYNGSFVGVGKGLLENENFMEWNQPTPQIFLDFFESDEFSIIEEDYRDKGGNVCYDSNGNAIKQYKTKFYSHPFAHGKGTTAGGDEYEWFSIGKHGATLNGYSTHFAFASPVAGQEDVYKSYILLDTYQASKVTDRDGVTHIGSFKNGYPIAEIGVPETYIHPYRGYMEQGLRFEMQWIDILEAICMGRRGEGYANASSLELANHFCGDSLDIEGVSITTANEASNSFSVANTSAYANIEIGAEVSFDSVTNEYSARNGTTVVTRTITAKTADGTNTTFTFNGDPVNVYGRKLHASYMARTASTDSLTGLCAYSSLYPKGYQPFKIFNVEKPWGAHAYWLDWIKWNNSANIQICQTNSDSSVDNYVWNNFYFSGMSTSTNYVKEMKEYTTPHVVLPSTTYSGDSVTYYGVRQYWQNGTNFCIIHGRAYQNQNYKFGGQFYLSSCCNYAWTNVALNTLLNGCWGRVFRSVR